MTLNLGQNPSNPLHQNGVQNDQQFNQSPSPVSYPKYLQKVGIYNIEEPLPFAWNASDRCSYVDIQSEGLIASYTGPGKSENDAASVRANHCIPLQCGIFYFEIQILSKGRDGYAVFLFKKAGSLFLPVLDILELGFVPRMYLSIDYLVGNAIHLAIMEMMDFALVALEMVTYLGQLLQLTMLLGVEWITQGVQYFSQKMEFIWVKNAFSCQNNCFLCRRHAGC